MHVENPRVQKKITRWPRGDDFSWTHPYPSWFLSWSFSCARVRVICISWNYLCTFTRSRFYSLSTVLIMRFLVTQTTLSIRGQSIFDNTRSSSQCNLSIPGVDWACCCFSSFLPRMIYMLIYFSQPLLKPGSTVETLFLPIWMKLFLGGIALYHNTVDFPTFKLKELTGKVVRAERKRKRSRSVNLPVASTLRDFCTHWKCGDLRCALLSIHNIDVNAVSLIWKLSIARKVKNFKGPRNFVLFRLAGYESSNETKFDTWEGLRYKTHYF